jgi:hypothetical protein
MLWFAFLVTALLAATVGWCGAAWVAWGRIVDLESQADEARADRDELQWQLDATWSMIAPDIDWTER